MMNESQRRDFVKTLKQTMLANEGTFDYEETKEKHIYRNAFTQKKRNQLLERFFKVIFSEVWTCVLICLQTF